MLAKSLSYNCALNVAYNVEVIPINTLPVFRPKGSYVLCKFTNLSTGLHLAIAQRLNSPTHKTHPCKLKN